MDAREPAPAAAAPPDGAANDGASVAVLAQRTAGPSRRVVRLERPSVRWGGLLGQGVKVVLVMPFLLVAIPLFFFGAAVLGQALIKASLSAAEALGGLFSMALAAGAAFLAIQIWSMVSPGRGPFRIWPADRFERGLADTVTVGSDGVEIAANGERRFVSFARVAAVLRDGLGVVLRLDGGGEVLIKLSRAGMRVFPRPADPGASALHPAARAALDAREELLEVIHHALKRPVATAAARERRDVLDRQGRDLDSWARDLRALGSEEPGYRSAGVDPDELGCVMEDPREAPARRVAAAFALATGESSHRARIAHLASACVDDPLRRALERAAEGELDEAEIGSLEGIQARSPDHR